MRKALLLPVLMALAACQSRDLSVYHHTTAHPIELRESQLRMVLGAEADLAVARARVFAAQRPNNGSSFVIAAEPALAEAVRAAVIAAGVDPRDVAVAPPAGAAELTRIDRFASVANCAVQPERIPVLERLTHVEDGFGHANPNSSLLGCSVRNNVVQMTDDPRSLVGPQPGGEGRDGARSADVYQKWAKGQAPWANAKLPTWTTSDATSGSDQ